MFAKAYVEITNVCNRSCHFCPKTERAPRFMSLEEFWHIASQLRPYTRFLYFHVMGEPLLHPQLKQLLTAAQELDFRVILTTNGTLLEQSRPILLQAQALHKLNISLHSFGANEPTFSLEQYIDACAQTVRLAAQKGIVCNFRLWNLDSQRLSGVRKENDAVLSLLETHFPGPWQTNTRGYQLAPRVFLEWGEQFEWPDLQARDNGDAGFCYGLRDQIGVLCDGTLVPCCLDHEGDLALGNVLQIPLAKLLSGPRAQAIYTGFSNRRRTEPLCRRCGYATRFDKSSRR